MRECINAHTELLKIFENFSHCQKFFAFEKLGNFSKLKHTAFIELNQKGVVEVHFQDEDFKKFWGK